MRVTIWHRVGLAVVGLLVVLVGLVAWDFTREYGSGLNFAMEGQGRSVIVYEVDEQRQDAQGHAVQIPVFEGSEVDALAYTERRRAEETSYLVPTVVLAAGGLLVLAAFIPLRRIGKTGSPGVPQ